MCYRSEREAIYISHVLNCVARVEGSENYISLVSKCVTRVGGIAIYRHFQRCKVCYLSEKERNLYVTSHAKTYTSAISVVIL